MAYKNDLIASIEDCLGTFQNCRYQEDPVIKTMKGRLSSIKKTLETARALPEHEIIGVLNGMNKEATSLVSCYIERVAQVERQKFDQRSRYFRALEIFLLIVSTLIAGTAAYRSIANAEESIIISNRQIKISESQFEIQKNQTSANDLFETKIRELEEHIRKIEPNKKQEK